MIFADEPVRGAESMGSTESETIEKEVINAATVFKTIALHPPVFG